MAQKKELSKTSKDIQRLSQQVVNTGLEKRGEKVEKLTEEIFATLSKTTHPHKKHKNTLGQVTADLMTQWAGSWTFIIGFLIFLVIWMLLNTIYWGKYISGEPFDPFPFILLNLVLSCIAAIQAPIILMSQNREAQRDRLRAEYDYQVNRKAEREIRDLKMTLARIEKKLK